ERNRHTIYNRLDRAGLVKASPAMVWDAYFRALGHPEIEAINVHAPAYIETVDRLMTGGKAPAYQVVSGIKELPPRWRRCVAATNRDLAELVAQPFVKRVFGPDAKAAAETMIHAIVTAFGHAIDGESWMDAETQKKAHDKLAKLLYIIGYPEK